MSTAIEYCRRHDRFAAAGVLTAEATEIARSRKLVHASVRITDEDGQLVAMFQGTAYIKGQPFPPPDEPVKHATTI